MKKLSIITVLMFILTSSLFSKTIDIKVTKMHCPLCTTMVKKAIKNVDGVETVKVKLNTKNAHVVFDEEKTNTDEILDSIKTTGYTGVLVK